MLREAWCRPCFSCPWPGAVSLSKGNNYSHTPDKGMGSQSTQTGWRVSPDTRPVGQRWARVQPACPADRAWGQPSGTRPMHCLSSQLAVCRACGTCSQRPLPYVQATETRDVTAKPLQPSRHWPRPLPEARGLPPRPDIQRTLAVLRPMSHSKSFPHSHLRYRCPP